ncbi:OLC1v1016105C1 [Oldenlandia corymbosa var. corymbosa]|uniref:OLC1v1016105C1 n=1 Tax=Oldenlandia corymbosa var. corymbosa TaxID=529605 RepID=A0AAV1E6Q0_OLDCO|nr:OLC1v1016105C1 [Oldenlandia corymbosa var. corymbosa]
MTSVVNTATGAEANQFQLENAAFPQQVSTMQHRQGSAVVPSQLSGQEGALRLTYIPQGTTDVGVQGTAGVTINQGPVGTGNNQGAIIENARQAGQHVQATNDRRFILYQNRVAGNNTATTNLDDSHIPQGSGIVVADSQIVDLGHKVREEPYAAANDNQQQNFETSVDHILNAEDVFSRMIEDKIRKELGTEIPELPGKPYPRYVEWEPLPRNFKIPDFQQFSGEDEKRPEDHISLFELQCGSRSSQRDNTEQRSVRAAPVNDRECHRAVHPKFPTPPLRKEKMTRTHKRRWQRVVNKQNRGATGKLGRVQEEQPLLSQQASMNEFSGQEDRRSQLWRKVDTFFPPLNMVYMLPKTFRLKEPATTTTIIPKAVAHSLVVPEAASFVTETHDATVGGIQLLSQEDGPEIIATDASPFAAQAKAIEAYYYNSEVGPYHLVGMDKYGRPQQATMRRDMSLLEWMLLQEVKRPYNYNMLRSLLAAPSIEEVFNEDN